MTKAFSSLPLAKRAKRYRELADEAEANALHAHSASIREGYSEIAQTWLSLAVQIEATFDCAPEDGATSP